MPLGQSPRGTIAHPLRSKIDSNPPNAMRPIIIFPFLT
jgi:hypothetical protein